MSHSGRLKSFLDMFRWEAARSWSSRKTGCMQRWVGSLNVRYNAMAGWQTGDDQCRDDEVNAPGA
jgi:hypothetical protein